MISRALRVTLLVALCAGLMAASAAGAAATTTGSGHWTWQSPLPHGSWVSDASFINANEGWEVTWSGDVLHTTDGGKTWVNQSTGEDDGLVGVAFVDALEGWAVGEWGAVLHTTDGGATWERQVSGSLDTLYSVVPVDADHVWTVGESSVLATTDGGVTWGTQISAPGFADSWGYYGTETSYYAAAFSDAQHGCVVGVRALHRQAEDSIGAVWRTSDGGMTWQETDVPGTTAFSAVTVQGQSYWACGSGNAIAHSSDGGATWAKDTPTAPVSLTGIAVNGAGEGWAVGSGDTSDWYSSSDLTVGVVLHTADAGVTWEPVADQLLGRDSLVGVTFDDAGAGRVVGESGAVYVTADGGATWTAVGAVPRPWITFSEATKAPDGRLWVLGSAGDPYENGNGSGVVWTSDDGGATWEPVENDLIEVAALNAVYAGSGGEVWLGGVGGRILHSADAGATWEQQATGVGASIVGLSFSDQLHGWAVSSALRGAVLRTADGGEHWAITPVGSFERYFFVQAKGDEIWLGGMAYRSECEEHGAGLIAHSIDGGATWTTMPAGPRAVLDIAFTSPTDGWALSGTPYYWDSGGALLRTTDGGATWNQVKISLPQRTYGVRQMAWAGADEGWVVAESENGAVLLHTIDAGAHWGAVSIGDVWSLRGMYFSDSEDGWLLGGNSTILATTDGGGMAPVTASNTGRYVKWINRTFTARFVTADDGYGLAPTQTRVGDGPWEDVAVREIKAPSTHANDGFHLIHYRGVDNAGNKETARKALVAVDTRRPTLQARSQASGRHFRIASLRLKSTDALSYSVRMSATVYTTSGKRVRLLHGSLRADGAWHSVRYPCILPVGAYRLAVQVKDLAGNSSAGVETIILRVVK